MREKYMTHENSKTGKVAKDDSTLLMWMAQSS